MLEDITNKTDRETLVSVFAELTGLCLVLDKEVPEVSLETARTMVENIMNRHFKKEHGAEVAARLDSKFGMKVKESERKAFEKEYGKVS